MTILTRNFVHSMTLAAILALLALPSCSWAEKATELTPESNSQELSINSEATNVADEALVAESEKDADKRRELILAEATQALEQTEQALKALEEKRTDDALEALSIATGKLDLLIAREPDLALAPTDVAVTNRDIVASNDDIETVIDAAEDALDDGRVQDARQILTGIR